MNRLIFNRHELKYLVDWKTYNRLIRQIAPFTNPDSFSGENNGYSILSLYYDNANYDCYYSKIDGEKIRQKLRMRWYLSDDENNKTVYLELKKKNNNQVLKRRLKMDTDIVDKFLEGIIHPDEICKDEKELSIAKEILYYYKIMRLKPQIYVHYLREAHYGRFENGLRITFDKKVSGNSWSARGFALEKCKYIFNPFYYMVMEIKFFNSMPRWLINILNNNNLSERRLSKYCMCIEAVKLLKLNLKEEM